MPSALITGTSSGLGHGLAENLLKQGWDVFGCSRRQSRLPGMTHRSIDLTDYTTLPDKLQALLTNVAELELVVLNAGILGEIRDLNSVPLEDAKRVMETNVWANKAIMDWLHASGIRVGQVVMISSGASILGNRGWGSYALSKATLNMMAKLYAHEFPDTHICALAPGIIDTSMMDYLCEEADAQAFPALKRLRDARSTETMPSPSTAADKIIAVLPKLQERPSGSFIDIREILEPEVFKKLYGAS